MRQQAGHGLDLEASQILYTQHSQAGDDEKRLILFRVQTELIGEVAALVIACVEHKPERLGFGDES